MNKVIFFILTIISFTISAADVVFTVQHPGTRTDGAEIVLSNMNLKIECGLNNDGQFTDWVFEITNLETINGQQQTITSPESHDYWCRAYAIDIINGLISDPSDIYHADFIDPPSKLSFEIQFVTP